jgi:RND family efflux transporter MFP subunit
MNRYSHASCLLCAVLGLAVATDWFAAASATAQAPAAQGKTAGNSAVDVTAFTTPFRDVDVASDVAGVVTKVHAEEGDHVAEGQPLVELKSDLLRARLEVSKARVVSAETQVAYYEATYRTRKMEYERAEELYKKKVGSQEDRDKAQLEMDLAKVSIESAKAQKKVSELTVAQDEEELKRTVIRAPFAGDVFRIMTRPGEAALEQRPVVKMVCVDPLYVVTYPGIGTKDRIRVGMDASLSLENAPGKRFLCKVSIVDVAADASSGTYRIKLTLPNPDGKITAGSKGTITFNLAP